VNTSSRYTAASIADMRSAVRAARTALRGGPLPEIVGALNNDLGASIVTAEAAVVIALADFADLLAAAAAQVDSESGS